MAQSSYVESLLGGLTAEVRRAFKLVFDYLLANLRLGRAVERQRSENFQAYFYATTTPATANQEFSIAHSLGTAPYLVMPVLPCDTTGYTIVRLAVTKPADDKRVYLASPETNAPIMVLIEG